MDNQSEKKWRKKVHRKTKVSSTMISTPFTTRKSGRKTKTISALSNSPSIVSNTSYRVSKRSSRSSTTTTLIINQLAKQLEEEREARKKLQEELESIKSLSMQLLSSNNSNRLQSKQQ